MDLTTCKYYHRLLELGSMRNSSRLFILFATLFLFFLFITPIKAEEKFFISTQTQKFYSDNPFYPFKRLWEKLAGKILFFEDAKINHEKGLLNKRFSELKYAVENNLLDEIQRSSERFSYQAGVYTEKVNNQNDLTVKKKVINEFEKYASDAAILRGRVPEGSFTRLIQYDIDTLNILSNQLK